MFKNHTVRCYTKRQLVACALAFCLSIGACGEPSVGAYQEGMYTLGAQGFIVIGHFSPQSAALIVASDVPQESIGFEERIEPDSQGRPIVKTITIKNRIEGYSLNLDLNPQSTIVCILNKTNAVIQRFSPVLSLERAHEMRKSTTGGGTAQGVREALSEWVPKDHK